MNNSYDWYKRNIGVHQWIEQAASKYPNNIAVAYDEQIINYDTLNKKANQLAHFLKEKHDIRPGALVGIYLEQSPHMIISLLTTLKAGAAYIPIDSLYPKDRVEYMLENANAELLITSSSLNDSIKLDIPRILIEEDVSHYPTKNLETKVGKLPTDLIYVLYTSGSTGRPKGALLYHRSVVNLLNFYTQHFGLKAEDKALIVSSFSFDLTQKNILGMLMIGGSVYLRSNNYFDAIDIAEYISYYKISMINCTPSTFYPLLEEIEHLTQLRPLQKVFLGGEPIDTKRLQPIINHNLPMTIINTYGPTECTDLATTYILTQKDIREKKVVPIGKMLPNIKLYVLDERLNHVENGTIGELYIGGLAVGGGYINATILTQDKFILSPFQIEDATPDNPNHFIYKTGDLVKLLPDGNFDFKGRVDNQIKFRGNRIELSEIETVINELESVSESIVIVTKDEMGNQKLSGFIILKNKNHSTLKRLQSLRTLSERDVTLLGGTVTEEITEKLREHISTLLPAYMLPSFFHYIEETPLTPNAKVDRKSLEIISSRLEGTVIC